MNADNEIRTIDLYCWYDRETCKIQDQDGLSVPLDKARRLWDAGRVRSYNRAFYALASKCDFSVDRMRAFFLHVD